MNFVRLVGSDGSSGFAFRLFGFEVVRTGKRIMFRTGKVNAAFQLLGFRLRFYFVKQNGYTRYLF